MLCFSVLFTPLGSLPYGALILPMGDLPLWNYSGHYLRRSGIVVNLSAKWSVTHLVTEDGYKSGC